MTPRQSARLKAAELRLAYSGAEPDALYVTRFNPYDETLLYDVRRCRFLTISWPDWFEAQESGR